MRIEKGLEVQVTALAFHPDGKTMASADEDGIVIIWDLALAKRLAWAEKHKAAIWSLAYCQGGGQVLASGEMRIEDRGSAPQSHKLFLSTFGRVVSDI